MQTLGLSDSTPRIEGRLKSLLWPTIRNAGDYDQVTRQGFWVCQTVAALSLVFGSMAAGWGVGLLTALFYFLAGVGVRERSRFASITAFATYLVEAVFSGIGLMRVIFLALLLANVRGNWLASRWKAGSDEWQPQRLSETLADRFADQWPPKIWRWGRYVLALLVIIMVIGLAANALATRSAQPR